MSKGEWRVYGPCLCGGQELWRRASFAEDGGYPFSSFPASLPFLGRPLASLLFIPERVNVAGGILELWRRWYPPTERPDRPGGDRSYGDDRPHAREGNPPIPSLPPTIPLP